MLPFRAMDRARETALITAIASKIGKPSQIASMYGMEVAALREFATENVERIREMHERLNAPEEPEEDVSPAALDALWITQKTERLKRLQAVAEEAEVMIFSGGLSAAELSTAVREFRSYLSLAAQELGQLLNRGAGDGASGDTLSVEIAGVDMESLR